MRLRRTAAILAAKALSFGCKLAGKQGVTMAGKLALQIDPDILKDLAGQVREKIFVVCGTNGKTTTNNLLCSAVEAEGKKLVCNHTGSNMLMGVAAAFVLATKWNGNLEPLPGPTHSFRADETIFVLGSNRDVQRFLNL